MVYAELINAIRNGFLSCSILEDILTAFFALDGEVAYPPQFTSFSIVQQHVHNVDICYTIW